MMWIRSLAIFFAILAALGAAARVSGAGFDPTMFWIDLRFLPPVLIVPFLVIACIGLLMIGAGKRGKWLALIPMMLAVITLRDAVRFYILLGYGRIESSFPVALSGVICVGFAMMTIRTLRRRCVAAPVEAEMANPDGLDVAASMPQEAKGDSVLTRAIGIAVVMFLVAAWAVVFAVAQMFCHGKTDYARHADVIVVLGARVYADGRLSDALADRVRTGAKLYHEGRAPMVLMSGGPDEPGPMRDFAVTLGVPADAIVLDPDGVNTRATIDTLSEDHPRKKLLAVSHFYHLPRISMAARQAGLQIYTTPADETYTLSAMPKFIAREVFAFWYYLFSAVIV